MLSAFSGWGDAQFYPARESSAVGMLAALLPGEPSSTITTLIVFYSPRAGPAVIHMAGLKVLPH
jgi:hypothetical protein